jgi:hypothetical protein
MTPKRSEKFKRGRRLQRLASVISYEVSQQRPREILEKEIAEYTNEHTLFMQSKFKFPSDRSFWLGALYYQQPVRELLEFYTEQRKKFKVAFPNTHALHDPTLQDYLIKLQTHTGTYITFKAGYQDISKNQYKSDISAIRKKNLFIFRSTSFFSSIASTTKKGIVIHVRGRGKERLYEIPRFRVSRKLNAKIYFKTIRREIQNQRIARAISVFKEMPNGRDLDKLISGRKEKNLRRTELRLKRKAKLKLKLKLKLRRRRRKINNIVRTNHKYEIRQKRPTH